MLLLSLLASSSAEELPSSVCWTRASSTAACRLQGRELRRTNRISVSDHVYRGHTPHHNTTPCTAVWLLSTTRRDWSCSSSVSSRRDSFASRSACIGRRPDFKTGVGAQWICKLGCYATSIVIQLVLGRRKSSGGWFSWVLGIGEVCCFGCRRPIWGSDQLHN
jgi:hypothetical protein